MPLVDNVELYSPGTGHEFQTWRRSLLENDLYITDNQGDEWNTSFYGKCITIISPVGPDGGKMRVIIDGNDHGLVNLYSEVEKHQEKVFFHKFARKGKHTIQIICADGKAAIDALIID